MSKVIEISKAKKMKERANFQTELERHIKHKQEAINTLIERLQTITIDDSAMYLLSEILDVVFTVWRINRLKNEHVEGGVRL